MEEFLSVADMCELFDISKSTVHKISCRRLLPTYKPFGKYIYFKKTDVEELLKRTRTAALGEFADEALGRLFQLSK